MKKVILLIILTFLLTSCNNAYASTSSSSIVPPISHDDTTQIQLNVFESLRYDENSPERNLGIENIILYTDAPINENNSFSRDDGNMFCIKATTSNGEIDIMPLDYFQFATFDIESFIKDNTFIVLVNIATGAAHEVREYTFDSDKKSFLEKSIYKITNINNHKKISSESYSF